MRPVSGLRCSGRCLEYRSLAKPSGPPLMLSAASDMELPELYVHGTRIPKNLLAPIGRMTITFSIMDTEMNKVISAMLGDAVGAVIAAQNKMFGTRFDTLKLLRKVATLDSATKKSFDDVLALIGRLRACCTIIDRNKSSQDIGHFLLARYYILCGARPEKHLATGS